MKKQAADDPEFEALRGRYKADIEASGMTRGELIDLLARNLASYDLLCSSYESNCRRLEEAIELRVQLCDMQEQQAASKNVSRRSPSASSRSRKRTLGPSTGRSGCLPAAW